MYIWSNATVLVGKSAGLTTFYRVAGPALLKEKSSF